MPNLSDVHKNLHNLIELIESKDLTAPSGSLIKQHNFYGLAKDMVITLNHSIQKVHFLSESDSELFYTQMMEVLKAIKTTVLYPSIDNTRKLYQTFAESSLHWIEKHKIYKDKIFWSKVHHFMQHATLFGSILLVVLAQPFGMIALPLVIVSGYLIGKEWEKREEFKRELIPIVSVKDIFDTSLQNGKETFFNRLSLFAHSIEKMKEAEENQPSLVAGF